MQRLAYVTFTRRIGGTALLGTAPCRTSLRLASTDDNGTYVNKVAKKKVEDNDDERWLEAELDENINTPEERYARSREIERLHKLVKLLDEKHGGSLEQAVRERKQEVESLKSEMEKMRNKIDELTKKDK